jgi:hypothetical protein
VNETPEALDGALDWLQGRWDLLRGRRYLKGLRQLLRPLHAHQDCANRQLHFDEYVSYIVLHLLNPSYRSMRSLQQASRSECFRRRFQLPYFSLGSFSEAGSTFQAEKLLPVIERLSRRVEPRLADPRLKGLTRKPVLFDGTLVRALQSMDWASWLSNEDRSAKMHLEFDLLRGAPTGATLTDGNADEREELRQRLDSGKLYILDRGLVDYSLQKETLQEQSSFLIRLHNNASYKILQSCPISEAAAAAGVEQDLIVSLGCDDSPELRSDPLRLVRIRVKNCSARPRNKKVSGKSKRRVTAGDYTLLLATDLLTVDVLLIALLYRYRWQIELYFRWFKHVLHADDLLSRKANGLSIIIYCALIVSLVLSHWTGRTPTKRIVELVGGLLFGYLTGHDLQQHLDDLNRLEMERASKKI